MNTQFKHTHFFSADNIESDGNGGFVCTYACSMAIPRAVLEAVKQNQEARLALPHDQTTQAERDTATSAITKITALLA